MQSISARAERGRVSAPSVVVEALARHYARTGYVTGGRMQRELLAAECPGVDLEPVVEELAAVQAVLAGRHSVVLGPAMKLELMRLPLLRVWAHSIATVHEPAQQQDLVDGARDELRLLVDWATAQGSRMSGVLHEYAACLAGVLLLPGLQPEAFTAVHWHFGDPQEKLRFVRGPAAARVRDPLALLQQIRRSVPQDFAASPDCGDAPRGTDAEEAAALSLIEQLTGRPAPAHLAVPTSVVTSGPPSVPASVPAPRRAAPVAARAGSADGVELRRSATPHVCGAACRASHG